MKDGIDKMKRLVLFVLFFLLAGCVDESSYQKKKERKPEQVLENFTAFEAESGIKKWYLVAKQAQIFESESNISLKDFNVTFYAKNGRTVDAVLTAPEGSIDAKINDFRTKGKTVVVNSEKDVLECTDLYYDTKQQKIFSDSEVTLTRTDSVVKGRGFEATPDMESVIIKENVVSLKK